MSNNTILTLADAAVISSQKTGIHGDPDFPQKTFEIGEKVYVRSVTYAWIARVSGFSQIGPCVFLHADEAFYVANSEQWMKGFLEGKVREGEPIPGHYRFHLNSTIDVCEWNHEIFKDSV